MTTRIAPKDKHLFLYRNYFISFEYQNFIALFGISWQNPWKQNATIYSSPCGVITPQVIRMKQIVAIAADHAGVELKNALKEVVVSLGHEVNDLGTNSTESVDYPDYADLVATAILQKNADKGILICGSGIGMSIAANRYKGIRAALVSEPVSATLSRKHNDSNILVLGARTVGVDVARICVNKFLTTDFEGGRHEQRVAKLDKAGC